MIDVVVKQFSSLRKERKRMFNKIKNQENIIMIFFVVKVVYTISPNVAIPSKSVNKGALLTTVIWVVSTFMFSFYVTNIANYSKFYGNLSNLIIVMICIYWLCYVFVFGMTFNEYNLTNKGNRESV